MSAQPRLTLSWRLAASISAIVVAVMVAVSLPQRLTHQRRMDERTAAWVRALAQPIGGALRAADTGSDLEASIGRFRATASSVLGRSPSVGVVTESGFEVYGVEGELQANFFVIAEANPDSPSTRRVVVNPGEFQSPENLSGYWLHVLATIVALSMSLYLALLYLVSRPLERLLDGVRLMEMGYWGEVPDPRGAWEIRWLSRRFSEMGANLERTVQNLAAAERRGGHAPEELISSEDIVTSLDHTTEGGMEDDSDAVRVILQADLEKLELLGSDGVGARALAEEMLRRGPAAAEQIGDIDLKTRIEDQAFAILDPEGLSELRRQIGQLAPDLLRQADMAEKKMLRTLALAEISVVHVQRRIKGLGSVWRKMQRKSLLLSQIHDLLALRVVVASTDECYRALHEIHTRFEPIVGRFKDYIADPKPNGYQSIHTSVRLRSGVVCEVQIRSLQMHQVSECGDSAHWRYRLDDFL